MMTAGPAVMKPICQPASRVISVAELNPHSGPLAPKLLAPADATVRPIGGGEVAALAALGAVLHEVVRREREAGAADLDGAASAARTSLGGPALSAVGRAWRQEFTEGARAAPAPDLVGDLLVLAALNTNPAAEAVRELIHDGPLRDASEYDRLLEAVDRQLRITAARAIPLRPRRDDDVPRR